MSTRTAGEGLTRARQGVASAGSGSSRGPRKKGRPGASPWTLFAFAVPSLVLLVLLNLYPVIYAAYQSLRDGSLISAGDFVGLENYTKVLTDPEVQKTAANLGFEIDLKGPVAPAAAAEFLAKELASSGMIIKEVGIEPQ